MVAGILEAAGTATVPISITGMTAQAGWWRGLQVGSGGTAVLQFCDIGYGGSPNDVPNIALYASNVIVQDCRLHHSAGAGIELFDRAIAFINRNRIEQDGFGMRAPGLRLVDARNNWWGHASGPHDAARNPQGTGKAVNEYVLFEPLLRTPNATTMAALKMLVQGAQTFAPGSPRSMRLFGTTTPRRRCETRCWW